jgi:hypothetical protein
LLVPDQLSRQEVALILQRTADLERKREAGEDAVTSDELMKIADDLGMSRDAVTQALAESKAGLLAPVEESTLADRFYGRAVVQVHRFVPGRASDVAQVLDVVLREQAFEPIRRGSDWQLWSRTRGMWGTFRHAKSPAHRLPRMVDYRVRVSEAAGGPHPVLVQIEVDASKLRSGRVSNAITSAVIGAAGAIVGALFLPMPVELLPLAGGAGLAALGPLTGRAYYRDVRTQIETTLNGLLDFLEHEPRRLTASTPKDLFTRFIDFLGGV